MAYFSSRLSASLLLVTAALTTQSVFASGDASVDAAKPKRPNIVILIADDMGYGDIGSFGSEIQTPNLDKLAGEGMSFSNFHAGATCSPTRTMLISGVDNHRAGLGNMHEIMADNQFNQPGYEGHLYTSVVSLATVLSDSGYNTYMTGKWHLGGTAESIPYAKGFKRSFALAESGADNWVEQPYAPMYDKVHYFEDDKEVSLPTENYFSSDFYTEKMISYIEADREEDKPFLVWMGYQAVHYPHQAPKKFIDKYNGVYDKGWEDIRQSRLARQRALGIVPASASLDEELDKTSVPDWLAPDWETLPDEEKRFNARRMQAYAGMLDNMDYNIGRLVSYLEEIGELDNTLIVFMADNGPDPNLLSSNPAYRPWYEKNYDYTYIEDYKGDYSTMGQKGSYADYGPGWAAASATPNSYYKTFSTEGGLRVPFIAWYPKNIEPAQSTNTFLFVKDVYPTILEVSGVAMPGSQYKGRAIYPPSGKSAWGVLTGEKSEVHASSESIGYELAGSSAVFRGKYKLSRNPPPKGNGDWELYDIIADQGEVHDLAKKNPELVAELLASYKKYEKVNGVIPVPEGYNPLKQLIKNTTGEGHP